MLEMRLRLASVSDVGLVGHVGGEAFGGGQAGTFSDE